MSGSSSFIWNICLPFDFQISDHLGLRLKGLATTQVVGLLLHPNLPENNSMSTAQIRFSEHRILIFFFFNSFIFILETSRIFTHTCRHMHTHAHWAPSPGVGWTSELGQIFLSKLFERGWYLAILGCLFSGWGSINQLTLPQCLFPLADVKTFSSFWTFDLGELKIPPVNSCAGNLWKWDLIKQARPLWVLPLSVNKHTRHCWSGPGALSLCVTPQAFFSNSS